MCHSKKTTLGAYLISVCVRRVRVKASVSIVQACERPRRPCPLTSWAVLSTQVNQSSSFEATPSMHRGAPHSIFLPRLYWSRILSVAPT